jgi:hypothetical protein
MTKNYLNQLKVWSQVFESNIRLFRANSDKHYTSKISNDLNKYFIDLISTGIIVTDSDLLEKINELKEIYSELPIEKRLYNNQIRINYLNDFKIYLTHYSTI